MALGLIALCCVILTLPALAARAPRPARHTRLLEDAEAIARATARSQNRWAATVRSPRCRPGADAAVAFEAARARALLAALGPAVDTAAAAQGASVEAAPRLRALSAQLRTARSFAAERVEPWARPCPTRLSAAPGLGPPEPGVDQELDGAGQPITDVAIIALDGVICPGDLPGQGQVLVVRGGACVQAPEPCRCAPAPVRPGEVLSWRRR
ncbi:MAG: hypothetical protein JNM72_28480 [Deltaproteobacteria bacterium]|nr:hypothetical protein [Deltaproteobacteria bacterium]